jgi:ribosomal protein S18 acetylase RimI-like enzyme
VHTDLGIRPLRADEYGAWSHHVTSEYARDLAENGDTPRHVADRLAVEQMAQILPEGLGTPGHFIHALVLDGVTVGTLWLARREMAGRPYLFIFDIEIAEAYRGRGLGRAAMLLAEREAKARGIDRIELNVFGGNTVARNLYRSLGYVERAVQMGKDLDGSAITTESQPA